MYIDEVRSSFASFANAISMPFEVLHNLRSAILRLPQNRFVVRTSVLIKIRGMKSEYQTQNRFVVRTSVLMNLEDFIPDYKHC
jgi:hypothetical protein